MTAQSIPPERLLRAQLLQILYSIRSERLLMEQLDYNLLMLIPLELEIQLCRSHLAVMSLRHELVYGLRTIGTLAGDLIPPAILHTLIENELTHGTFTTGQAEFVFERTQKGGIRRYRLVSPEATAAAGQGQDGTALRYVRARLEESYPGRWTLVAGPGPDGWQTVIEIADQEHVAGAQA